MATYLNDLNIVQVAKETTWGTPVPTATAKLMCVPKFDLDMGVNTKTVKELRASLARNYNLYVSDESPSGLIEMNGNYQDVLYGLESAIGIATPSGAGPYMRLYAAPLTAAVVTPRFMTLQFGQTGSVYQLAGGLVTGFTLKGDDINALQAVFPLIGKAVTAGTFTALSDRVTEPIMPSHAKIYVDTWVGTLGATELVTSAFAWQLDVSCVRNTRRYLGSLYGMDWNDQEWTGHLKLSLEVNAVTAAYLTSLLTPGVLQLQARIKYDNGLATTFQRQLQLDFCGYAPKSPKLFGERGGVQAFDLELDDFYHGTVANWLKMTSINNSAAIV
jgi:hypothetical protein